MAHDPYMQTELRAMDTVVRSDSVQAALLWQRAQKSLSIGLELERLLAFYTLLTLKILDGSGWRV